jgi:8-oxo-dGTP pyrophosphatase MutT (NUDIX family)
MENEWKMKKIDKEISGWELGPATTVFTSRVVDIETMAAKCQRTGKTDDFYKFNYPDWVNIIALTTTGKMVLVKQYRFGSGCQEMEIPGGAIHAGEDPVAAGCRELLEETGYSGKNAKVIGKVCPNPALQDNLCYTILVENVECVAAQMQDELEDIEVVLMEIDEVFGLISREKISHGLVLNALMFYHLLRSGLQVL